MSNTETLLKLTHCCTLVDIMRPELFKIYIEIHTDFREVMIY